VRKAAGTTIYRLTFDGTYLIVSYFLSYNGFSIRLHLYVREGSGRIHLSNYLIWDIYRYTPICISVVSNHPYSMT